MPRVLPSQILSALDELFGLARTEAYERATRVNYRTEVAALLLLLDDVPTELIDLPFRDYTEFVRCRGALTTTLARWGVGDVQPVAAVGGKEPIECIRRLLKQCKDELSPPEPELPFIEDLDQRHGIEDQIHTAWANYNTREWLGATVFAGTALEALLLWVLKNGKSGFADAALNKMQINELIETAARSKIISSEAAQQAGLAKNARNLVHPGRASRKNMECSKASSLTALAGLYRIIEELKARASRELR